MGQNYGYETLMTELPTYMKQVLRFSIKEVRNNKVKYLWDILNVDLKLFVERFLLGPALRSDVALLHWNFIRGRLHDLFKPIHSHSNA